MGKPEQKKHFQDLSIDGMIRVKWILKKQDGRVWIGLMRLRIGANGRLL